MSSNPRLDEERRTSSGRYEACFELTSGLDETRAAASRLAPIRLSASVTLRRRNI